MTVPSMAGRLAVLALLIAPNVAAGRAATNWADNPAARDPAYAGSRALCRVSRAIAPPKLEPGEAAAPKDCHAERLYFGIGVPADPAAARRCALQERAGDPANDAAFAGTAMLMTIYANGRGAPRDLGMALALACTLDGAPEEMDTRVKHLDALRKAGPGPADFSFCDDVTSGAAQGACAAHDSAIAATTRTAALDTLGASVPAPDAPAFAAARAAAERFAVLRGQNEIDLSGTARTVFELEAEDAVRDDFLDLLQRLGAGKLAAATPAQRADADKALNAAYQAVMGFDDPQWGTPTKDGIKATQRAWLVYRDAVAAFAAVRAGPAAADSAVTAMTRRRTSDLKAFLS